MSRANKLALIEEIRAVAPKVYDITATQDMGYEFSAICSDGLIKRELGMLLATETQGNLPEWFYENEGDQLNEYEYNKQLDSYLCEMVHIKFEDLEAAELFALVFDDLRNNELVSQSFCERLHKNYYES